MASKSFVFRFDDVEVREREFSLTKAGKVLAVEPKAFRALLFLLRNPQKVVSKEELLNSVWGDAAVAEGSLTRCIWLLRGVLGDDIRSPRYIETVATVGYRFIGKVEVSEDPSGDPQADQRAKGSERRSPKGWKPKAVVGLGAGRRRRVRSLPGRGHLVSASSTAAAARDGIRTDHPRRPSKSSRRNRWDQALFQSDVGAVATRIYRRGRYLGRKDCTGPGRNTRPIPGGRFAGWFRLSRLFVQWRVESLYTLWNVRILGGSARRLADME